jgi:peptide/nickel transport system substrate-binding protein
LSRLYLSKSRIAVARGVIAAVIIVLVAVAGVGAYFLSTSGGAKSSSSTSSGSSSTSSSTSTTTSSTSSAQGGLHDTLTIDDVFWPGASPAADFNQLAAIGEVPYPNWLTYTVYQPLVTVNASTLYSKGIVQYLPVLAQNWTVSADQRTYTFNLKPGIKFSDGNPVTAYDIWMQMYGFYYLSGNSSGSFFESYNIFDFSHVNFGPSTMAMINQTGLITPGTSAVAVMSDTSWPIYAPSSSQIVFHLKAPFGFFLGTIVVYVGLIFDTQWLMQHGGFGTPAAFNPYFNGHPIPGTGPYVFDSFSENSYAKFKQNPTYWGAGLTPAQVRANPYIDPGHAKTVIVNFKSSDIARYTDLSSGQAQIAGILTQDYRLILSNPTKYGTFLFPDKAAVYVAVAMNTHRSPTNITAVRQAIVHAINYSDISQKVFFGGLSPMVGPEYPVFSQFYDLGNLPQYKYDTVMAQKILSDAGINPANLPPIEFRVVNGCGYCIDTGQIIQNDLAAIGLSVEIIVTPSSQYGCPLTGGTCSYSTALADANTISQMSWFGTGTFAPAAATPADNWLLTVSNVTSSNNWAIYANPTVQKCVNAWTTVSDTTQLINLCTAAQLQAYNDAPYIWLGTIKPFFGAGSVVWDKGTVANFYVDPVYSGQSSTAMFNTVSFTS